MGKKNTTIEAMKEKQNALSYEDFLRYLFFELEHLRLITIGQDGKVIFDATPTNEDEVKTLDKVSFEYLISISKEISKLSIGFNSFEALKNEYQKRLERAGSDKTKVIEGLKRKYIDRIIDNNPKLSKIYNDKKEGIEIKPEFGKSYSFSFFRDKHKVFEIIKFEDYLKFPENGKKETILKDFFPSTETEIVDKIQNEFKDLAIGKEMAILIYLLTKEKKILIIDDNNKNTSSRVHFLRAFTGKDLKTSGGISNFIEGTTGELKEKVSKKHDPSYIKISQRLDKMV